MISQNSFKNIPKGFLSKWQEIADMLAKVLDVPAALIMKTENEFMEVFISSDSQDNPYNVGEKEHWYGLYCETVIKSQDKLLIPNALKDKNWNKNPDIKLGMIAYLGFPINFPDQTPFGTLCVLDNNENAFSPEHEKLLKQFKHVIELDLALIQTIDDPSKDLANNTIQELIKRNKKLKQAQKKAEESEVKLRELNLTKDKFFSIIAHDLKSPFNSIMGFSELLLEQVRLKDYEGIDKYAGIIWHSSRRAMSLLTNLLEWVRTQTGKIEFNPEFFELVNYIKENVVFYDDIAVQKSITINMDIPHKLIVFADKQMINTVMRNLISNAIKFTREGGEVIISTRKTPKETIVSVRDNGLGIAPDRMEKLFRIDTNVSTPGTNKEKGTGLGLILCKEFVEKHGGSIWVESEEGKGSTFSFTLPCFAQAE